jgi:hypothetical protein
MISRACASALPSAALAPRVVATKTFSAKRRERVSPSSKRSVAPARGGRVVVLPRRRRSSLVVASAGAPSDGEDATASTETAAASENASEYVLDESDDGVKTLSKTSTAVDDDDDVDPAVDAARARSLKTGTGLVIGASASLVALALGLSAGAVVEGLEQIPLLSGFEVRSIPSFTLTRPFKAPRGSAFEKTRDPFQRNETDRRTKPDKKRNTSIDTSAGSARRRGVRLLRAKVPLELHHRRGTREVPSSAHPVLQRGHRRRVRRGKARADRSGTRRANSRRVMFFTPPPLGFNARSIASVPFN